MTLPPTFSRLATKTYHGIVSSVDLSSILPNEFQSDGAEPRLIVFCLDNHKANRVSLRRLIFLPNHEPNISICAVICFSNIRPNSAKWGLAICPVGDVRLRYMINLYLWVLVIFNTEYLCVCVCVCTSIVSI